MQPLKTIGKPLTEKHIFGEKTKLRCVRANENDERDWLDHQPVCAALGHYQILHAGIMQAQHPYEVVRTFQEGAFFIVTLAGAGRILINGRWHQCGEGEACLLPAYATNAFHCAKENQPWDFCWVRYRHPELQIPLIKSSQPILSNFGSDQFHAAMLGLLAESEQGHRHAIIEQWAQLIHTYVREFVTPFRYDDRLWKLWTCIERDLSYPWSLDSMASIASLSTEHLRRLCRAEHSRSPLEHVRWLRMQRAAAMLTTTDYKIEAIAYDVGYKNPVVFSTAFKKHFKLPPSKYRIYQTAFIA
ncbi:MAG: AraC family transcriptional regulator [Akkermansiaceae bacterium]|jgi:AraC-like DNA-binding protein|nr:AraC family transcriptional regulator [Akkermansiaceae bacterium]